MGAVVSTPLRPVQTCAWCRADITRGDTYDTLVRGKRLCRVCYGAGVTGKPLRDDICPLCDGEGENESGEECSICDGLGRVRRGT